MFNIAGMDNSCLMILYFNALCRDIFVLATSMKQVFCKAPFYEIHLQDTLYEHLQGTLYEHLQDTLYEHLQGTLYEHLQGTFTRLF